MMYGKSQARGEGRVKMNHLRTVQTRNVVVSNVMMSNAPKMTCPGDPRAQTHTQIVRAYLSEVYKMSEVCKITRTIQNRFDMGGRVRT